MVQTPLFFIVVSECKQPQDQASQSQSPFHEFVADTLDPQAVLTRLVNNLYPVSFSVY